jgi:hypothetical protein
MSGDNGNPFMIPLSSLNKGEVDPLKRTTKEIELMQLMTHITN